MRISAAEANKEVAEVRSAVALTDDQKVRLAEALGKATGKQVELKVVIDPSVLGGVVAQVGDTVIDGSVRSKLDQLEVRVLTVSPTHRRQPRKRRPRWQS